MTFPPIALALALSLGAAAAAQDGIAGVVKTIDGRSLKGRLTVSSSGPSAGRAAVVGEGRSVELDVAEITSFEREGAVANPLQAPHRVWLRSGHELPCKRLSGKPGGNGAPARLCIELPSGIAVDVPISMVRALRHGGSERPEPALFTADLQQPPSNDDLIYVQKDGKQQRSAVTVTGMQKDRIDFLLRGDAYDFELAGLTAVVFGANTGFAPDRQGKPRTSVELVTGERLEGRLLEVGNTLQLRLDEGAVIAVPARDLLRLQVASDRLVWLAELRAKVDQTPAFDRVWPWTIDRTVAGPGIVIDGKTFTRGLGLVPRTRLTYDLGGRFDVFEAMIGIDDRGGPQAHAVFRVYVDDAVAFESAPKTLGLPAEAVSIELNKAKTLAIEVDFGKNYDLGDYCAFADARVVQR
ncbi:MAG TPA: NPCBM/NEW2 domain-containing protein [Planctomycetota bacterium]|nr:NPCBM/NEW2 domain-containing protein [Planctomycetota bacterium]